MSVEDLPESKLGTKEHWDSVYEREVDTFTSIGDEGEIWFGNSSVEKMIKWIRKSIPIAEGLSVMDVGTGNGHLLFELVAKSPSEDSDDEEDEDDEDDEEEYYNGTTMVGVDYSAQSVELARKIGNKRGGKCQDVKFAEWDILTQTIPDDVASIAGVGGWDLVLDKGTFDALSLSSDPLPIINLKPSEVYPTKISQLLKPGGKFLITSCNFTEAEVEKVFTSGGQMKVHSKVPHKSFSFGGKSGSTVCTVAFEKI